MDPLKAALHSPNRAVQRALVEYLANEYAGVLFRRQTGVFAVVETEAGARQIVALNSGFRHEPGSAPAAAPNPNTPSGTRKFIELGPFEEIRDGERITYARTPDGGRLEYRIEGKVATITRVVAPDGTVLALEPQGARFGDVTVAANDHHAEMRLEDWKQRVAGRRILAAAPTRGCCDACNTRWKAIYGDEFDEMVPANRQTRKSWLDFRRELRRLGLHNDPNALAAKNFGLESEFVAKGDMARLRQMFARDVAALRAPNPQLMRIGRYLKVAGPAMMAFDALTSYAKAADQWRAGAKDAARH
jgi:hypothetical protein